MKTQQTSSPYFNARRSWNEHVGQVVSATKMWQAVGIGSLAVAAVSVIGMVSVAKQSRFVPYIVEVDKLGQVAAVRQASTIDAASLTAVIKAELATFITKARLVTPDQQLQANSIRDVYALLANSDPATAKMNEWFNGSKENNPFNRATKVLVSASINAVIPQSQDSWQVDWTETVVSRDGHPESVTNMRALVTTYLVPATAVTSEADIQRNPIGLYVKDLNWSKIGF